MHPFPRYSLFWWKEKSRRKLSTVICFARRPTPSTLLAFSRPLLTPPPLPVLPKSTDPKGKQVVIRLVIKHLFCGFI